MKEKEISQITLAIDIAPGRVKAVIIGIRPKDLPMIISESNHLFHEHGGMLHALKKALNAVLREMPKIPSDSIKAFEHIVVSLSHPWFKSDKKTVNQIEDELVRHISFKKGIAIENHIDVLRDGVSSLYDVRDAVLMNQTRDALEGVVVRGGVPERLFLLPLGHSVFQKHIADSLGLPPHLSDSAASLGFSGLWGEEKERVLRESLRKAGLDWKSAAGRFWDELPGYVLLEAEEPYSHMTSSLLKSLSAHTKVAIQDPSTILASYSENLL